MRVIRQIRSNSAEQQEFRQDESFPEPMCLALTKMPPAAEGSSVRFGQGASW